MDPADLSVTPFDHDPYGYAGVDHYPPLWPDDAGIDPSQTGLIGLAEGQSGGEQQDTHIEEGTQEYESDTESDIEDAKYNVEWKAVMKTTRIGLGTEEDVRAPFTSFWETTLRDKVEEKLRNKYESRDRPVPEGVTAVASVSKRGVRAVPFEFTGFDSGWPDVEEKLKSWACHVEQGHSLTVTITFRYKPRPSSGSPRHQGRLSATKRQRHDQALQKDAELYSSGNLAPYRQVYSITKCPGRPCRNVDGYCWIERGGRHFPLLTSHRKTLVAYVAAGNKFEGHNDMPVGLRQQLHEEAAQRMDRRKDARRSALNARALTPAPTPAVVSNSSPLALSPSMSRANQSEPLDIPGPYEDAIKHYVEWLQRGPKSEVWLAEIAKAGQVLLSLCMSLQTFHGSYSKDLLTLHGVKLGVAADFHLYVPRWSDQYRNGYDEADIYDNDTPGVMGVD